MSRLQRQLVQSRLPPLHPGSGLGGRHLNRRRNYTPTSWENYFDCYRDVTVENNNVFRVYLKGNTGPVLFLLHGGGYSGLSWSLFCTTISSLVECQVAALDLRGHGETYCVPEDNLSADVLAGDVGAVINNLFEKDVDPPPIILIGHSMGGAIAVHAVYQDLVPTAIGLVVIDVVEGTAMDALQSMQSFLRGRPPSFTSLPNAIEWCVRSGQVRNVESARVSMPGQLKNAANNRSATQEIDLASDSSVPQIPAPRQVPSADIIVEESEEDDQTKAENPNPSSQNAAATNDDDDEVFKYPQVPANVTKYVWRIDLSKTEKYWSGWFEGLSNMFLTINVPKLLLLAGVDRLDKDLTIGQMQGKFQMQVLPQCGHAVHEDDPEKVAEAVASFLVRHKFTIALQEFQRPFAGC